MFRDHHQRVSKHIVGTRGRRSLEQKLFSRCGSDAAHMIQRSCDSMHKTWTRSTYANSLVDGYWITNSHPKMMSNFVSFLWAFDFWEAINAPVGDATSRCIKEAVRSKFCWLKKTTHEVVEENFWKVQKNNWKEENGE